MNTEDYDYKCGIKRLTERVKLMHEAEKELSPTPRKKDIEKIATALEKATGLLEANGCAQFDIESFHDERDIPERGIGLDGWPIVKRPVIEWPSYKAITWHIRALAESARMAADQLPNE
jgi:hypothetical protein